MTGNKTNELRRLLDERGVEHYDGTESTLWLKDEHGYRASADELSSGRLSVHIWCDTPEQVIAATLGKEKAGKKSPPEGGPGPCGQPSDDIVHDAATLGRQKAKAHPYGYEPDTGAFDVTRCECGCLNDISATYCNDCGGVIEVDMDAEKEIYHAPRHSVFAEKHDDGSLELGGKRYVAATSSVGKLTVEQVGEAIERNVMKVAVIDDGDDEVEWREGWVCRVGFDYKAIADELNATLDDDKCSETALLSCPMCGSTFVQVRWIGFTHTHNGAFSAGYRGECCDCGLTTRAFDDEAEAIAAWNARAELRSGECEFKPFADEDWSEPNAVRGVCSKCSALMHGKDNYCPNCGARVRKKVDE